MPAKPEGVYSDSRGQWYFKVTLGRDPLTGKREQLPRRGFRTATEAAKARHEVLAKLDAGLLKPTRGSLTVDELLDLYLDGIDADERLSAKTRHDYREKADTYVRPLLGKKKVRDLTPEVVLSWPRKLLAEGRGRSGRPLAPNSVRLARAPLAGALKLALSSGIVVTNPLAQTPRPKARRSVPRHWSPEQAREFLGLMEGDRTYALWAFLMGSGLRIGELVALRWPNVDLEGRRRPRRRVLDLHRSRRRRLDRQEPGCRSQHRPRRRSCRRPSRAAAPTGGQAACRYPLRSERLRLHEADRRSLPSPVPLADARPHHRGARSASPHCARAPSYVRHAHARERGAAEGCRRASRARRPLTLHEPLQPRHSDNAARSGRKDRRGTLRAELRTLQCWTPRSTRPKGRGLDQRVGATVGLNRDGNAGCCGHYWWVIARLPGALLLVLAL